MLNLAHPGVYTVELDSGIRTVAGAPTSVALFVGPTRAGIDNRPITCLNFPDFERAFGGLHPTSSLSYSVSHFFANGGGQAVVIRLPVKGAVAASSTIVKDGGDDSLVVKALSSGAVSGDLFVEIDPFDIDANPFPASGSADKKRFNLTVVNPVSGLVERFTGLTTVAGNTRTVTTVVNDVSTGSSLASVDLKGLDADGPKATGSVYSLVLPTKTDPFGKDFSVLLSVGRLKPDGTDDDANSIAKLPVTVFRKDAARPASPVELITRLVAALNESVRASTEAFKLADATIEGELFERGRLLRLTVSRPNGRPGTDRVHDATVTLKDPSSGGKLLNECGMSEQVANVSRYRLGFAYPGGQVSAQTAAAEGDTAGQPTDDAFKDAVTALGTRDAFFNLLCLPDLVRPSATDAKKAQHGNVDAVYAEAARVCAEKFAFLLVDPPPQVVDIGTAANWKTTLALRSTHAGAWFPNVRVDDPLQPGSILSHPPSGAVAGVIARTDGLVGVWQAPAGTDAFLAGVYGPSVEVSDAEHGLVNPLGLNVIRKFPIYQTVAFGSRTIDGSNALASQWKYVPVRRTASYILRSLAESLRWAVHQPNGEQLWSQLRVNCTSFMQGLFRQGAFKGVSAREAYFVACDASTTTAADIDQGVVNIVIGFAPLKPAEFVVISLKQIVQPAG